MLKTRPAKQDHLHGVITAPRITPGKLRGAAVGNWVTVFGFPPQCSGYVRQQLEVLCGPVEDMRPGDGNFMHVCFADQMTAQNSLQLSGQLINQGKMMIGVIPYSGSDVDELTTRPPAPVQTSRADPPLPKLERSLIARGLEWLFDI